MSELTEEEFRKKNQWYSFTSAAWGYAGMASFFGAAGSIASGLISVATGVPAFIAATGMPTASAALGATISSYGCSSGGWAGLCLYVARCSNRTSGYSR